LGLDNDLLATIFQRLRGVGCRQAGISDHPPRDLVAVAAVNRIGEEAFHGGLIQRLKERFRIEVREIGLASLNAFQGGFALGGRKEIEVPAIRLARPGVRGLDAGGEIFARYQRQLIPLLGFAFNERTGAIG
jgi:hypothetical protein